VHDHLQYAAVPRPTPTPTASHPPSFHQAHTASTWRGCAAGGRAYLQDWCWRPMEQPRIYASGSGQLLQAVTQTTTHTPTLSSPGKGDGNVPGGRGGVRREEERLRRDLRPLPRLAWQRRWRQHPLSPLQKHRHQPRRSPNLICRTCLLHVALAYLGRDHFQLDVPKLSSQRHVPASEPPSWPRKDAPQLDDQLPHQMLPVRMLPQKPFEREKGTPL